MSRVYNSPREVPGTGLSFIWALVIAVIVELITLPLTILTTGHAGPEGPFALVGWLSVLLNIPGFFIVGLIMPSWVESLLIRMIAVFIINTPVFAGVILLLSKLFVGMKRRGH
jgi:hypothetical protein